MNNITLVSAFGHREEEKGTTIIRGNISTGKQTKVVKKTLILQTDEAEEAPKA